MRRRLRWHASTMALCVAACGGGPDGANASADHRTGSAAGVARDSATSRAAAEQARAARLRVLYVPADGFAYRAEDGSLTGVTVDIMQLFGHWLAAEHDIAAELDFVEESDWRAFYGRVRDASGGVFGLGNVTITEERRTELQFSPPYLSNVAVLITHDSVGEIRQLHEIPTSFATLRGLGFEGTLHERRVRNLRDRHLPQAQLELAASNDEILQRVAGGGYFAYIDAYNFWRALERGAPLRRHQVADDPAEEFGIIMPLDSDWPPLLQQFFTRGGGLRTTPAYRDILLRHLGEPLTRVLEEARMTAL